MMAARSRSLARATTSAALGPSPPMRMSSGPSSRKEKPRVGFDRAASTKRRDRTRRRRRAASPRRATIVFQIGETILDQIEPALRLAATRSAPRAMRLLIAVDADHARTGGRQDRARITAGAERGIDIDAAVAHAEPRRRRGGRARERDGPVRQRQHRCRCPSSFPCSMRLRRRHPGAQLLLEGADLLGGLREFRAKAAGLPDSKFVAETNEGRRVGDSRHASSARR